MRLSASTSALVTAAGLFLACAQPRGDAPLAAAGEPRPMTAGGTGGCGQAPLPDCPLQAWMKANMAPAMASGDVARLRGPFARLASMALPEYASWRSIAQAGGQAVANSDPDAVRRACKQCHDEHRARYRSERRASALP